MPSSINDRNYIFLPNSIQTLLHSSPSLLLEASLTPVNIINTQGACASSRKVSVIFDRFQPKLNSLDIFPILHFTKSNRAIPESLLAHRWKNEEYSFNRHPAGTRDPHVTRLSTKTGSEYRLCTTLGIR
jgi:hypothetical protein